MTSAKLRVGQPLSPHPVTGARRRIAALELVPVAVEFECLQCQEWYEPTRADQRFCSPGCRLKAHRAKERE